jgi:hypothetical protein
VANLLTLLTLLTSHPAALLAIAALIAGLWVRSAVRLALRSR